ncbi:hypothetical protein COLO4_00256 [Corchorus olitorius]|uniref:Uncharacterized protein n=1 Tax=Corchorus olitorius TaxID=93759 RepID=A0A1R3L476_9ROSI|nr:hypothetical protein COLO4_00256 [Corchorus olitorius]
MTIKKLFIYRLLSIFRSLKRIYKDEIKTLLGQCGSQRRTHKAGRIGPVGELPGRGGHGQERMCGRCCDCGHRPAPGSIGAIPAQAVQRGPGNAHIVGRVQHDGAVQPARIEGDLGKALHQCRVHHQAHLRVEGERRHRSHHAAGGGLGLLWRGQRGLAHAHGLGQALEVQLAVAGQHGQEQLGIARTGRIAALAEHGLGTLAGCRAPDFGDEVGAALGRVLDHAKARVLGLQQVNKGVEHGREHKKRTRRQVA